MAHIILVRSLHVCIFYYFIELTLFFLILAVAMKNDALNTYSIDKVEQQKAINFISFLRDKWETWFGNNSDFFLYYFYPNLFFIYLL